jgi:hypothetical protein
LAVGGIAGFHRDGSKHSHYLLIHLGLSQQKQQDWLHVSVNATMVSV